MIINNEISAPACSREVSDKSSAVLNAVLSEEKKIFGCESAPISLYSPKTRISSRDYIFSPGSSFQSECVRYMSFFLTSVIRKNEIPPLMPYVPLNSNEPMPFSLMVNGEPIIAEYPDGIVD